MKDHLRYRDKESRKQELLSIAQRLIEKQMPFIEGVRELSELYDVFQGDINEGCFSFFVDLDEETFKFPSNNTRAKYSTSFLEKSDRELESIEAKYWKEVVTNCRELIRYFGQSHNQALKEDANNNSSAS